MVRGFEFRFSDLRFVLCYWRWCGFWLVGVVWVGCRCLALLGFVFGFLRLAWIVSLVVRAWWFGGFGIWVWHFCYGCLI